MKGEVKIYYDRTRRIDYHRVMCMTFVNMQFEGEHISRDISLDEYEKLHNKVITEVHHPHHLNIFVYKHAW